MRHHGCHFLQTSYIGVILGVYWDYNGIMEQKMETTIGEMASRRRTRQALDRKPSGCFPRPLVSGYIGIILG